MSIPLAVGQYYRVTHDLTMMSQRLMNTFNYRLDTVGTETDNEALGIAMRLVLNAAGRLRAKYLLAIPPQVTLANTWIQTLWPTRMRKQTFVDALPGTLAGIASSANTAASIERNGDRASRHDIGRIQLPAANDTGSITNGVITAAGYLAALNALGLEMITTITTAGGSVLRPVLLRTPVDGSFSYVIGGTVQTTLRVMRRRTVGVGK